LALLSFVPPKYTQGFSMTLSFAERFEWGSLGKECLLLEGIFDRNCFELSLSGQQRLQDI
jgi:hypothetical protein